MSTSELLQLRRAHRDALLQRATEFLQNDRRVAAAWLHGSLGRGTADEWSDIDLWVVVADDHIDAIRETRREYAEQLGEPLIVVDAPQNAPPGGAFLSVVYGGLAGGPQHVDWTWQRQSDAKIPEDVHVLFDRAELPHAKPSVPQSESREDRSAQAAKQTAYFWMMVPIVAKYIARRQPCTVLNLLNMISYASDEVGWLVGKSAQPPVYENRSNTPPPANPGEQMALLRELAGDMERLMAETEELEASVAPGARIEIYSFLDLVDASLREGS